jgi:hypothetical protein
MLKAREDLAKDVVREGWGFEEEWDVERPFT